ncbi:Transmembrane protein 93 [Penicillium verhagenii]|nr:Transmembrane protein 93 [Penicillium verhagenii]
MAPTKQELSLIINPLVPEAVQHNNRVLSSLHSLTSFLLGLSAGILALQSAGGFIFYFAGTVLVSGLFHLVLIQRSGGAGAGAFFPGAGGEIDGSIEMDAKTGVVSMDLGGRKDRRRFVLRKGAWRDVWFGGGVVSEALSGFVLGWAGVGGVLR